MSIVITSTAKTFLFIENYTECPSASWGAFAGLYDSTVIRRQDILAIK
jgi:hypothetical protein